MTSSGDWATPDSSVVIAAFSSWNEHHEAAIEPLRMEPNVVTEYLRMDYPGKRLALPEPERRALITRFAKSG